MDYKMMGEDGQPVRRKPFIEYPTELLNWTYMFFFAMVGCLIRASFGHIFGEQDAENASLTSPIGVFFVDLPANMFGSWIIGLMSDGGTLGIDPSVKCGVFPKSAQQFNAPLLLGIRTGLCGSITTFASWNQQMVNMALSGYWLRLIFGYLIGVELALASVYVGEACAFFVSTFFHTEAELNEEDAVRMVVATNVKITEDRARADSVVAWQVGDGATAVEVAARTAPDMMEMGNLDASDDGNLGVSTLAASNLARAANRNSVSRISALRQRSRFTSDVGGGANRETRGSFYQSVIEKRRKGHRGVSIINGMVEESVPENGRTDSAIAREEQVAEREATLVATHSVFIIMTVVAYILVIAAMAHGTPGFVTPYTSNEYARHLWVALFTAPFGACLRWKLSQFNAHIPGFFLGTFLANFSACTFDGILTAIANKDTGYAAQVAANGIQLGFCGCLSTVSTFCTDIKKLYPVVNQDKTNAYAYILITCVSCFVISIILCGWSH